jgi:phospholipid N-methyltransferase
MNRRATPPIGSIKPRTSIFHLTASATVLLAVNQVLRIRPALHVGIKRVPSQRQLERQARIRRLAHSAKLVRAAVGSPGKFRALRRPSNRAIAELLNLADWGEASLVVELYSGAGRATEHILRRARPDATIIALEADRARARRLRASFNDSRLQVVSDSPERLAYYLNGKRADVVVSATSLRGMSIRFAALAPILAPALANHGVILAMDCLTAGDAAPIERDMGSVLSLNQSRHYRAGLEAFWMFVCTVATEHPPALAAPNGSSRNDGSFRHAP